MQKNPNCPRCSGFFSAKDAGRHRKPYLLKCGHTFCETCLTQLGRERKTSIVCPTCFVETSLSEGEPVAKSLNIDVYLTGLLICNERVQLNQELSKITPAGMMRQVPKKKELSGDQLYDRTPVLSEKVCGECCTKLAAYRCMKCECIMCATCFDKVHSMSNTLRHHQAIPVNADGQLEVSPLCKVHEGRPIEYYCEDDDTPICSRCVIMGDHKGHSITSMEDKNKSIISEMEPSLQVANQVHRRLRKLDKTVGDLVPDVRHEMGASVDAIKQHFQHLHGILQVRENALIKDLHDSFKSGVDPVQNLKSTLQEDCKKLELTIKAAQRIMNNNNEIIVNAKEILEQLDQAKDIPCIIVNKPPETTDGIRFIPGTPIDSILMELGSITGELPQRFSMHTMREMPEEFINDDTAESLSGSVTPVDSASAVSVMSEDVIIEEEQEIILESDGTSSVASKKSDEGKKKKKKKPLPKKSRVKGHCEQVYVTHIRHPCQFMVQLKSEAHRLRSLAGSINNWCNSPAANKHKVEDVDRDDIVLARYTGDKQWYRARIKNVIPGMDLESTRVEVIYIDYGNSEVIGVDRLRNMQARFMKHPEFSTECCLFDIVPADKDGTWSVEAIKSFAKMVENKAMLMSVVKEVNNVLHVDLCKPADEDILDDRPMSVRDALVFLEIANFETDISVPYPGGAPPVKRSFLSPESKSPGDRFEAVVTHAGTPDCFYVQEIGEESQYLAVLMAQMQETYSREKGDHWAIFCPMKDMICVSQFPADGMWYRAQVVGLPGDKQVDVLYVDYGNIERVPYWNLRKVLDTYVVLPTQAQKCSLQDIEPLNLNEGWTEEVTRWWSSMVTMKTFSIRVTELGKPLKVVLREVGGDPVHSTNSQLAGAGLARSTGKWSAPVSDVPLGEAITSDLTQVLSSGRGPKLKTQRTLPTITSTAQEVLEKIEKDSSPTKLSAPSSPKIQMRKIASPMKPVKEPPEKLASPVRQSVSATKVTTPPVQVTVELKPTTPTPTKPCLPATSHIPVESPKKPASAPEAKKRADTEVEVVVSHYVSPSDFHVQLASCGKDGLDSLMEGLQETYSKSEPKMVVWEKGIFCAALYSGDWKWYRAKISKVIHKNLVEVFFVDFGFTDAVSASSLRPLAKPLRASRCFAFHCHLANMAPAGDVSKWSRTACEFMAEQIKDKKLYVAKKGNVEDNSLPIDLIIEENIPETALEPARKAFHSLIEMLRERGLAIPRRRGAARPEPSEPPKVYPVLRFRKPEHPTVPSLKVIPLYVDYSAVIHAQRIDADEEFLSLNEKLQEKFKDSEPPDVAQEWELGQGVVVFYKGDQTWCRATITNMEPHRVQIHYIDYGNSEWVSHDRLRADVAEFTDVPQQSVQCLIHDLKPMTDDGKWSVPVLEFMHNQLVNNICTVDIIDRPENEPLQVNIYLNEREFGSTLCQYGMAQRGTYLTDQQVYSRKIANLLQSKNPYKSVELAATGKPFPVAITHVELPNVVYFQLVKQDINESGMSTEEQTRIDTNNKYLQRLEQLSVDLNKIAPSLPVIPMPKIGLSCCAQFSFDHCWYRAVIIDLETEPVQRILVLYVDYGNSEIISLDRMRALPPKYMNLPAQATRCELHDLMPPAGALCWAKEALQAMIEAVSNKNTVAVIQSHNPVVADIFDTALGGRVLAYKSVLDTGLVLHKDESRLFDEALLGMSMMSVNSSTAEPGTENEGTSHSWAEDTSEIDYSKLPPLEDEEATEDKDVIIEGSVEVIETNTEVIETKQTRESSPSGQQAVAEVSESSEPAGAEASQSSEQVAAEGEHVVAEAEEVFADMLEYQPDECFD